MKNQGPIAKPNPASQAASKPAGDRLARIFPVLFGLFFGLTLLKFGNLILIEAWKPGALSPLTNPNSVGIAQNMVDWPADAWEWALNSWPVVIGYGMLIGLLLVGIFVARWKTNAPPWLVALPAAWLLWQFVSASHSVDADLTAATLKHFAACVACFYLGLFALSQAAKLDGFFIGLLAGFFLVLADGLSQHFGGLEDTRKQFMLYIYPTLKSPPPELMKKMTSTRIFSTLFYPNALAGAILLCLPPLLGFVWSLKKQFTVGARTLLIALVGLPALGCLFWSGSKGGWLLMLFLGLVWLLTLKFERKWKIALVAVVLVCGLAGFAVKYSGYFKKGATSVSARFDYWRAAVQTAKDNPAFGTGPGTFAIPYHKIKRPEAEMARLTHNDYLQQASDSGVPGFILFTIFMAGGLIWTGKRVFGSGGLAFTVWLGVLGFALQSLMEFGLYIPALAWLAFALLGWLLTTAGKPFDKTKTAS